MEFVIFIICLASSGVGAIVGAGGGMIIKPVMDMLGILPVSTTSFCSGCAVLGMSVSSLLRTRKNGVTLHIKISTGLAVGAVLGGLFGKGLFELVRNVFGNERTLGAVQAVCMTIITFFVFLYICKKDSLPSMHITNMKCIIVIGVSLGLISSFLGIGGGPTNVAVLFFFFSMNAKEVVKSSLYIIIFSQISSIAASVVTHSVPEFTWMVLCVMIAGGIGGAIIGCAISSKIRNRGVERVLKYLLLAIACLDFYNILKYTL